MAKLFRWIADSPRFIEVGQRGPTGRAVEGNQARMLQYQLDKGKQLPPGWYRDWRHEHRHTIGGRRHAFVGGQTPRYRHVTQQDIIACKPFFEKAWNGICEWHPIEQDYVWCSHVWSWMEWVADKDAAVVFYACYGEFADVTELAIRDDDDPRSYLKSA